MYHSHCCIYLSVGKPHLCAYSIFVHNKQTISYLSRVCVFAPRISFRVRVQLHPLTGIVKIGSFKSSFLSLSGSTQTVFKLVLCPDEKPRYAPPRPDCADSVKPRINWQQNLLFLTYLFERILAAIKRNGMEYLLPILYCCLFYFFGPVALVAILPMLRVTLKRPLSKRNDKS